MKKSTTIIPTTKEIENILTLITKVKDNADREMRKKLYELTMRNVQKVGKKKFVFIPFELLFVDKTFQRIDDVSMNKIKYLFENWEENSMDALRGSAHPEDYCVSIIDGMHRAVVAILKGETGIEVELLELSEDISEREIQEAFIFATQDDGKEKLSPVQRHNANIKIGVYENIALENILNDDKYKNIIVKKKNNGRGLSKVGVLSGFGAALQIIKKHDEEILRDTFDVIIGSRWILDRQGLSSAVLKSISNLFALHSDSEIREKIKNELCTSLVKIKPNMFYNEAEKDYPHRDKQEQKILYLEDQVCDALGIERKFLINTNIERVNGHIGIEAA